MAAPCEEATQKRTASSALPLLPAKRATGPPYSQLARLPTELFENIASNLEDELLDFRLFCREVQQKTWRLFKERYFALRQVWMERHSLETLAAISKYEPLASAVRKIVVATHYFPLIADEDFEEAQYRRDNDSFTRRDLVTDQATLLAGGFATLALSNAFPRFPNLRHLRMGEAYKVVKPPSYAQVDWHVVRKYYLSNSMARFYSKNKIYPSRGLTVPSRIDIEDVITPIWLVVLTTISQAGLQLESFRVKRGLGINIDCFSSCTTAFSRALRLSCGDKLQTLRLHVIGPWNEDDEAVIRWSFCFPLFLANFPNLDDLTLVCNSFRGYDTATLVSAIHDLPVFTKLRSLTLALANVNCAHLLQYLGKCKAIQKLALCSVVLFAADRRQSAWGQFLTALPKTLDLQRLEVLAPLQCRGLVREGADEKVDFDLVGWKKGASDRKFTFEQPDLSAKLERIVESISSRESTGSDDYNYSWSDDDSTYDSDSEYGEDNNISWTEVS